MTYNEALQQINQFIVTNGNNEITANVLRPIMEAMVDASRDTTGLLEDLETEANENLVAAINELKAMIPEGAAGTPVNFHFGEANPNTTPPASFKPGDNYWQSVGGNPVQLWIYNGFSWVQFGSGGGGTNTPMNTAKVHYSALGAASLEEVTPEMADAWLEANYTEEDRLGFLLEVTDELAPSLKRQFLYTADGFREVSSEAHTFDQVLEAGNEAMDKLFALRSSLPEASYLEAYSDFLRLVNDYLGHASSQMSAYGLLIWAGTDLNPAEREISLSIDGLETSFDDTENQGSTLVDFEPPGLAGWETRTMTVRYANGFFASEEYVDLALQNTRKVRFVKSTGFPSTNSTQSTVLASIPLGEDLDNKRFYLLVNALKTGANAAAAISIYLHDAALPDGDLTIPATVIGTYTTNTGLSDQPFVRERMYVAGGKLYAPRPDTSIQNDTLSAQANAMSEFTLPSTPHIILVGKCNHAGDSLTPKFATLEF